MYFLAQTQKMFGIQGSTYLMFACTDFHAHEMVLRTCSCTQNYVNVGANLHCLSLNVLSDIVFPIYFDIREIYQTRICSTERF